MSGNVAHEHGVPVLDSALHEAGELLLNGWGYNWYRRENLLRADDLLIRNQADAMLGDALAAFRRAEAMFRNRQIGTPSRERPLPAESDLGALRDFQAMAAEIDALRTRLRGAAAPPPDKISRAAAAEAGLLERLSACDLALAALVQALRADSLTLTPGALANLPAQFRPRLDDIAQALEWRDRLLDRV